MTCLTVPMQDEIKLRPLTVEDAEAMARALAAPSLYEFTGGEPPTVEELRRRYAVQTRGHSSDGSERWINEVIVLLPDEQPIGYVQATIPENGRTAEIAWVVGEPWQGRGIAKRAASLLVERLRVDHPTTIIAHIHPDHVASQRIAQHLGLAPSGVMVDGEERWEGSAE